MNPEDIQKLKDDIAELNAYKKSIDEKQVTFPLDKVSQDVIQTDLMVPTFHSLLASSVPVGYESIEVNVNGKKYFLQTTITY